MGRITPSVGLTTGFPIASTVDQLMTISSRPRELLSARTEGLFQQQVAVTELTAMVIGIQFSIQGLGNQDAFDARSVTSSAPNLVAATSTGSPSAGTFDVTPIRRATSHQLLSGGMTSASEPLGAGELSLRFGGFIDRGIDLDELNGGAGIEHGKIKITDRSGSTAIVDLRFAVSIDDVLQAINEQTAVNVTAATDGDRLKLTDNTGQTVSNLKVQGIAGSLTAADLGLDAIDVAANEATGQDILSLHDDLQLSQLNDGNGVQLSRGVADLEVAFRDGSSPLQIEFLAQTKGATAATGTTEAAHGVDAQVLFTSVDTGAEFDGVEIQFVDDESITAGNETVAYDSATKKLTFQIDQGATSAVDIINALNNDSDASQIFTAATATGGDGTGDIDVADTATTSGGAVTFANEQTLGELLATINAADPDRLSAQISASGDSIELHDLTTGSETFSVSSLFGGTAAEDLGIDLTAVSDVVTSRRGLGGLKTVLLSSLGGGQGLGVLGLLSLTDRSGETANVDLSTAQTLDQVISAINSSAVGIKVGINGARNGITLSDTSGGIGNLVIANGDGTNTADSLRISGDAAVSTRNSGSLDLQIVSEQTSLDSLNNGRGVGKGSFTIADSSGKIDAVNLSLSEVETVGDILDLINGLDISVEARINQTGDGVLLVDTAEGTRTLVVDQVSGTAAQDLHITGEAVVTDLDGTPTQIVDGATTLSITVDDDDTLLDLVDKVSEASSDISLSIFNSGNGRTPFRLSVTSTITGAAGALMVDGSQLGIEFKETTAANDALLLIGSADANVAGALARSSNNTFDNIIGDVSLEVLGKSNEAVTIDVTQTEANVVSKLNLFVEQYNRLKDKLDELTFFSEIDNTTGLLFGSTATLQVEQDLTHLLSSSYRGAGEIRSFAELGLRFDDSGKMQFNEGKFRNKYAANPDDVKQFFTEAEFGAAAKVFAATERLAGAGNSVLVNRTQALQRSIDDNNRTIADLNVSLERERETLLRNFIRMDEVVGRLQSSLSAISLIQVMPPLFRSN